MNIMAWRDPEGGSRILGENGALQENTLAKSCCGDVRDGYEPYRRSAVPSRTTAGAELRGFPGSRGIVS